ncbi:MAG: hypothetical protein ACRDYE_01120 [Acidimicrobiales bacterium]
MGVLVVCTLVVATQVVGFVEPAAAQPPTTTVLVPPNNATVSGTQVVFDASASSGTTQIQFVLIGGTPKRTVIATAAPTIYGWIAVWNSTTVPDGTYRLRSVAHANGVRARSAAITITVNNPPPSTTVLIPSSGATVDTTQTSLFDAGASPGVTQVLIEVAAPGVYQETLTATPTIYGWMAVLAGNPCPPNAPGPCDFRTVPGTVVSVASYANGVSAPSPTVNVTIFVFVGVGP